MQGVKQHFGRENLAAVDPLVQPFEVGAALFDRLGDAPVGQRPGIAAAGLVGWRQVGRVQAAKVGAGLAAEKFQGGAVAVEKTAFIEQHHRVGGRFVEGAKFYFRLQQRQFGVFAFSQIDANGQQVIGKAKAGKEDGADRAVFTTDVIFKRLNIGIFAQRALNGAAPARRHPMAVLGVGIGFLPPVFNGRYFF